MPPVIRQSARFRTTPRELFNLYIDSRKHSLVTGARARISRKAGASWSAFNGMIGGRNLFILPDKMIVQAWRSRSWDKQDWSILVLTFHKRAGGSVLELVHIGVPGYDQKGVRAGWPKFYWGPWKQFLAGKARGRVKQGANS
jgi:activator of HSP90 ATPase